MSVIAPIAEGVKAPQGMEKDHGDNVEKELHTCMHAAFRDLTGPSETTLTILILQAS